MVPTTVINRCGAGESHVSGDVLPHIYIGLKKPTGAYTDEITIAFTTRRKAVQDKPLPDAGARCFDEHFDGEVVSTIVERSFCRGEL